MKKILIHYIAIGLAIVLLPDLLIAQRSSRYGNRMSPTGTIRVLLVFAEAVNDPWYDSINYSSWPKGQMPVNPDLFLDTVINSSEVNGILSKYFHQASFGELEVVGDYVDTLVKIDYSTILAQGHFQVLDYLNDSIPYPGAPDITTAHGYTINDSDFDRWILPNWDSTFYQKEEGEDDYIDMVYIFWRVNSKYFKRDDTGQSPLSQSEYDIKEKTGVSMFCVSTNYTGIKWKTAQHEIAHNLLGDNWLHTAGNFDEVRTTLPRQGGYSLLGDHYCAIGMLFNGWDRWRLGWKNPKKFYPISALDANTLEEVETDLEYSPGAPFHDYILQDFVSTGDVIRIQLPYLQSGSPEVRNQYLWLENHQMLEDNLDLNMTSAKGLYAYIQVGYDDLEVFDNGSALYLSFLHGLGNYDFTYTPDKIVHVDSGMANPFTGYNIIQAPAYNLVEPNIDSGGPQWVYFYDEIFNGEVFYPEGVVKDGIPLPQSDYYSYPLPKKGTIHDPFTNGRRIGIGTNPSTVPIMTYNVPVDEPFITPREYDNRTIYLNGLSITLGLNPPPGTLLVRVAYQDYNVFEDTRWCGPVVLKEGVRLGSDAVLTLDQGLTPTRPVNPILFNGEKIYADPTVFTAENGSVFSMEDASELIAKNNSAYISEYNALLEIEDSAVFRVKTGSTLLLRSGSNLVISGSGKLEVETGGCLCIENGANITLQDPSSLIHLLPDVTLGVNTAVLTGNYDCRYNIVSTPYSGSGAIVVDVNTLDKYVQNEHIYNTRSYTGRDIWFGEKVTTTKSFGPVTIHSGANVTTNASGDLLLDKGFEAAAGAQVEFW